MTFAQVVETSVTNNSSFQNYTHRNDHTIRIIFTVLEKILIKENSLTKILMVIHVAEKNHSTLTQSIQAGIAPENSAHDFFLMLSHWKLDQFQDT